MLFRSAMEFEGYKIDFLTMEDVPYTDFGKYDLLITTDKGQVSTLIKDYYRRKNECRIENNKFILSKPIEVPCLYMENDTISDSTNPESKYPFQLRCGFSKGFINRNHLTKAAISGSAVVDFFDFNYYIIYRNTDLKPKYKINFDTLTEDNK